jgi:uncharacterized membrane protein YccC
MKIKKKLLPSGLFDPNYYRIVHGIKTAIACIIGLAIERHFAWPSGQ